MSEAPCSNPKFLLHLHRASQQFTCVNNQEESRKSPFECKTSWYYVLPSKNQHKIKYTGQNHLNNSDQLYIVQHTNKQTNIYKRDWKVGACRLEEDIIRCGRSHRNIYSRAGGAAAAPGAAFACSVIAGRHGDWRWVRELNKAASKTLVRREREREKEKRTGRKEGVRASKRERREIRDEEGRF